jgi:ketopantoate reductase
MNELESMVGVIVGLGENHGVPTPVMAFAYAMLKPGLLKAKAS